ncbi:MAG: site-specific DNA-methyltransferase [Lachnospiraceae bacterium]|nr:site-specific DNA-methyltransferase [Lachnospiraceae bacterium]
MTGRRRNSIFQDIEKTDMEQHTADKVPTAVYGAGRIKLCQGDFLNAVREVESESVDMVFTDPPFELTSGGMKSGKLVYPGNEVFRNCGFCTKNISFDTWIPEVYRVMKNERYFYVMSNDRNIFSIHKFCIDSGFRFCELLVMDKKMTVPSTYYPKRAEFILMYRKGKCRKSHFLGSTVMEARLPRGKEKRHPTEKPVSMIEHLIRCSTLENELCLDPFMGSCPAGEACIRTGRRFIGVEIEQKWFAAAQDRITALLHE